jgi:multisubunit Na+/H+ antiporter MnhB subunit
MKIIGWITTALVTIVLSALWSGYVLSVLWGWFISPALGVPQLSVGYAIGLTIVVRYLTYRANKDDDEDESMGTKFGKALVTAISMPAFSLLFGWVVTWFL